MPYHIKASGELNEINDWLHKNIGDPEKYITKWKVLPYGYANNIWVIRLFHYDHVLLTKLRWE